MTNVRERQAKATEERNQWVRTITHSSQAEFRLRCACEQYDRIRQTKTEIHAKEHEDVTKGIYYAFSVVLREEGGKEDGAAVVAANNYCKKCIT